MAHYSPGRNANGALSKNPLLGKRRPYPCRHYILRGNTAFFFAPALYFKGKMPPFSALVLYFKGKMLPCSAPILYFKGKYRLSPRRHCILRGKFCLAPCRHYILRWEEGIKANFPREPMSFSEGCPTSRPRQ